VSTVRLARKNAQAVVAYLERLPCLYPALAGALRQLKDGLAPRRLKLIEKQRREEKRSKREVKNAETSAIYADVEKRADGKCEACGRAFGQFDPPHLDHYVGRGKAKQSVRNCWLIHGNSCHRQKHAGHPSAAYWHGLFAVHCDRHGYRREAADARAKFEAEQLVVAASKASKVFHEGQPPHGSTSPASEVRSGHEESARHGASSASSVRAARPHASRTGERPSGAKAQSPSGQPRLGEVPRV
jgi:hypothetical protein